ncbi:MAG: hypothetical protein MRQ09_00915 [Candidatus Midichloria sp.]|nr:hypothetical protein [Candidatus Midichloria sp.]
MVQTYSHLILLTKTEFGKFAEITSGINQASVLVISDPYQDFLTNITR